MMLPALRHLADGQSHSVAALRDHLAKHFGLSADDRAEKLPSGRQSRFDNRVAWVGVHLSFARLIQRPGRGLVQITEQGISFLSTKPTRLDLQTLRQLPHYLEARGGNARDSAKSVPDETESVSPEELIDQAASELRAALTEELLELIKTRPPVFFEQLVLDLMQALGYGHELIDSSERLGRGGDQGLDGVIREDRLGLDVIYLQAKRWSSSVGASIVREFLGALDQAGAKKGVLITTSSFTKDARVPFSKSDKKISLIDGAMLASLMIDNNLGVTTSRTVHIKRVDSDYFDSE